MEHQAKLESIVREFLQDKDRTLGADESLFESGLLDSFALPDLVAAIEKAFEIRIPDSDLIPRKFDTIERIETYLNHRS